jgi:hypothetical protein
VARKNGIVGATAAVTRAGLVATSLAALIEGGLAQNAALDALIGTSRLLDSISIFRRSGVHHRRRGRPCPSSSYFLTSEHLLSLSGWAASSAGIRRRTL